MTDCERLEWKRLQALVRRATDEEVSERFIDFRAMAHALTSNRPAGVSADVKPWRGWKLVSGLALIGMAACAIAVTYHRGHPETDPSAGQNSVVRPAIPEITNREKAGHAAPADEQSAAVNGDDGDPDTPLAIARLQGRFSYLKGGLAGVVASAILVRDATAVEDPLLLDIESDVEVVSITQCFEEGNYERCLELLDQHVTSNPALRAQTACTLLRALLLQQLHRDEEMNREIARIRENPVDIRWSSDELTLSDRPDSKTAATSAAAVRTLQEVEQILVLWEALGLYRQGEQFAEGMIQSVRGSVSHFGAFEVLNLYTGHARMKILLGDYAAAVADVDRVMALPLDFSDPEDHLSPKLAEKFRRNTVRTKWQGLEQEFPEFGDYVAKTAPW